MQGREELIENWILRVLEKHLPGSDVGQAMRELVLGELAVLVGPFLLASLQWSGMLWREEEEM